MSMLGSFGVEAHRHLGVTSAEPGGPITPPPDPPPDPPPVGGAEVVLASTGFTSNTDLGWTQVHNAQRGSATNAAGLTTKQMLGKAATILNQHLIGFGSGVDPKPGATAAYNWSFMDSTFGFPTAATGYFSAAPQRCLTVMGCPLHMRSPKSGLPPDPMGPASATELTSLSLYPPPHSSWFVEYGKVIADFAVRYPHVKYFHVWNELKGFYFNSQASGSNLVPTGSGLPAGPSGGNRWWYEGYTAMYNEIYRQVKAVRPDAFIVGPYNVLNSLTQWKMNASDWSDDAFPDLMVGKWGVGDKKVLATLRYFIANCRGADALCVDYRNIQKDSSVANYYKPTDAAGNALGPGAPPDLANVWLTNADKGLFPRLWKEGPEDGAWNNGQRMADLVQYLRDLGASSPAYQRPVCDARTINVWYAEWYAYGSNDQFHHLDPHTGNYYTKPVSGHAEEACAFAWGYIWAVTTRTRGVMAWKPEGTVQGNVVDTGDSNPLALYRQYRSGQADSLQETALMPVCQGLKDNFPRGTTMFAVTSTNKYVWGLASPTKVMLCNRKPSSVTFTYLDPNEAARSITLNGYEVRFFDRGGGGGGSVAPSGFDMPTADPAGMTLVFEDDFTSYGVIPIGSFPAATGGNWGGYPNGTADTSGNGDYNMSKTCSVSAAGVLDIKVWSELVGGAQLSYGAAPWPIIDDNRPTGVIGDFNYGNPSSVQKRANIYYGQIEFAFRCLAAAPGWKTAWLLWPDLGGNQFPKYGEIDFPEGAINGTDTIHAFMHRMDATTGSDQASRNTGVIYADPGHTWHVGKIIWKPNFLEFWLDGAKQGATETVRVPNTPMHWVFQTETQLSGGPPPVGNVGHMQVDWIRMHQLNGF